jgi:hypothetical protein
VLRCAALPSPLIRQIPTSVRKFHDDRRGRGRRRALSLYRQRIAKHLGLRRPCSFPQTRHAPARRDQPRNCLARRFVTPRRSALRARHPPITGQPGRRLGLRLFGGSVPIGVATERQARDLAGIGCRPRRASRAGTHTPTCRSPDSRRTLKRALQEDGFATPTRCFGRRARSAQLLSTSRRATL